jgi:hypothetical protein
MNLTVSKPLVPWPFASLEVLGEPQILLRRGLQHQPCTLNLRIVLPTNYAGPDGHEPDSLLEIPKLSGTTAGLESHCDLSCEALQWPFCVNKTGYLPKAVSIPDCLLTSDLGILWLLCTSLPGDLQTRFSQSNGNLLSAI